MRNVPALSQKSRSPMPPPPLVSSPVHFGERLQNDDRVNHNPKISKRLWCGTRPSSEHVYRILRRGDLCSLVKPGHTTPTGTPLCFSNVHHKGFTRQCLSLSSSEPVGSNLTLTLSDIPQRRVDPIGFSAPNPTMAACAAYTRTASIWHYPHRASGLSPQPMVGFSDP